MKVEAPGPSELAMGPALRFPIAVGISASLTIGSPILMVNFLGFSERVAVAIAMVMAFCVNFFLNKFFVFRSRHKARRQLLRFLATNILMRIIDYIAFLALFSGLGLHYLLAMVLVLSVTTTTRFFLFSRIFASA